MKEVFANLPRTQSRGLVLLDTCFVIDSFVHHKEKEFLGSHRFAMTSFNVEELVHVLPKVSDGSVKERVRSFFRQHSCVSVFEIPVSPGDREGELSYVRGVDEGLARDVADPSDAVLVAAAILSGSVVMTKDKHHLFTAVLQNHVQKWGVRVLKSFHEL